MEEAVASGRSSMKIRNRRGPNTLPGSRRRRLPVVDPTSWAPPRCKWRQAPPLPLGREKLRSLRVFGYGASEAGQAAPSAHPYTTTPLRH